jgi:ABC-2 type transport system ATP-binding protein
MNAAVEIQGLSVRFERGGVSVTALDRLDAMVQEGHVFGLLGPNGAGKTTLMHVLLGFVTPTTGQAAIFGTDVRRAIARQRIGYLPEHPDTYRFMTARELLHTAGRLFGMRGTTLRARSDALLERLDLTAAANRTAGTFSRGMLQRVCLAQALINDPDLVILDEPTGGMDPFGRLQIREMIAELKARGKTVLLSSHELSEVELVCDTFAILHKGRVITGGTAAALVPAGESLERFFIRTITAADAAAAAASGKGAAHA